jgi:hypothetical protein
MQIVRNGVQTVAGPRELFTGAVYIDTVATPSNASRVNASSVHFRPVRGRRGTRIPMARRST